MRPVTSEEFDTIMAGVRTAEAERKRAAHLEATRLRNEAHIEAGRLLAVAGLTETQRRAVAGWLRHLEAHELIYAGCGGCGGGAGEAADILWPDDPNA
jgi:hypothetical protein